MLMEYFIKRTHDFSVKDIHVTLDEVAKPSGAITQRIVINYPDSIAIVPFIKPDKFIVVNQYRYALQRETLEFPAGKIDKGESPEQTLHRELLEETGYEAKTIKKVYSYTPALGYSTEILHMYFATDLELKDKTKVDPDEISSVKIVSKKELWEGVNSGEIKDPKIAIGLLWCEKLCLI